VHNIMCNIITQRKTFTYYLFVEEFKRDKSGAYTDFKNDNG